MSWATEYIKELRERPGYWIWFRPQGRSMEPLIFSGQNCAVQRPFNIKAQDFVGRIALVTVDEKDYLHLIGACAFNGEWLYRIENASGHVNGWVKQTAIHGLVIEVKDD